MNKEKITTGIIIFLLILPMSIFFPWVYHHLFSLLTIDSWFLEKIAVVATMVFFITLLLPRVIHLKAKLNL